MKARLKLLIGLVVMIGTMFAATYSSYGCWFWSTYQRECPKSLILKD